MFCSFDTRPKIVRLHGRGSVFLPGESTYDDVVALHPAHPSTRAVVVVDVERISDSCGFGVPVMEVVGERDLLRLGAERRGPDQSAGAGTGSEGTAYQERVGGPQSWMVRLAVPAGRWRLVRAVRVTRLAPTRRARSA